MKIKYLIAVITVLMQAVIFSACAGPSPKAVIQENVSGQAAADFQGGVGNTEEQLVTDSQEYSADTREQTQNQRETIYVHICGAVQSPGVYVLPAGSRLWEAVDAAGGFSAEAYQDYCNLATVISDGMQYRIPTTEEALSGELPKEAQENESSYDSQGLLDINRATAAELMELPGIGQTRADAIIAYREEHGAFASKEDITQVTGIKGATYEKIESYIIVR